MIRPAILIAGPTAAGKSALALELARALDGVVINADALQVYGHWQVLSARPDCRDIARAPHRLYGHVAATRAYSVGDWLRDVADVLAACRDAQETPIIVGGTGLYLSALTEGLAEIPAIPRAVRAAGDALRQESGAAGFVAALRTRDPEGLARIDQRNPMRLQRAWEVLEATGRPLHQWQAETGPPILPRDRTLALCLDADPAWLLRRIETRFAAMCAAGAISECARWTARGLSDDLPAARAIGRAEITAALAGEIDMDDAARRATIATRQFAKRQRTWFRSRMGDWHRIALNDATPKATLDTLPDSVRSLL